MPDKISRLLTLLVLVAFTTISSFAFAEEDTSNEDGILVAQSNLNMFKAAPKKDNDLSKDPVSKSTLKLPASAKKKDGKKKAKDNKKSKKASNIKNKASKAKAPAAPSASKNGVRGKSAKTNLVKSIQNMAKSSNKPGGKNNPVQMGNAGEDEQIYKEFKKGVLYRIDYYEYDLIELVKQMANKFKVNFLISDKVKGGKITIVSPNPVTREEAWRAFISALKAKDLTIVRVGKFYKVIPIRNAQRSPMKLFLDGGRPDSSEETITYMLKLKYLSIKDVERVIKNLKSKSGELVTFEPTNSIIITDSAINIRRIINIINELDLPSGRDSIHVIDIYYASSDDIAEKLQQIFGDKAKKGKKKKRDSQVTISNIIADERTNQLIVVAPRDSMSKILDMINRLDVPIPGDGQIHVYYLENANAEELASTLTSTAGRGSKKKRKGKEAAAVAEVFFEGEVKITADKATNSLIIVASQKDYSQLKRVISKLDIRRRQVFVEAVIMEVTLNKTDQLGLSMNGGYTFDIDGEQIPLFGGTTLGTLSSIAMDPTTLSGMAVGLRGPDLEGTEGILGQGISIPAFGVVLQMLQTDSDANVLSTPHILTMDNEEAEIIVGSNVPFITGQARDVNNRPVLSIQRQDVALTMKIKPQINESDFVRLKIQQELTELASISETLGPTTTKRAAKSTVVVKDNQTIVIGGLLRDIQTADAEKVPFFGDIPILGRLFRRDKETNQKTNLLIFLTPHIIKDEEDFKRIFKRKMDERNEFLRKFYGTDDDYEFEIDYAQKTGALETIRFKHDEEQKDLELKRKEDANMVIAPPDGHSAQEIGLADGEDVSRDVPAPSESKASKPKKKPGERPTGQELMDKLTKSKKAAEAEDSDSE